MARINVTLVLCVFCLCYDVVKAVVPKDHLDSVDYDLAIKLRHLNVEFFNYFHNITIADLVPAPQARLPSTQDLQCLAELSYLTQSLASGKIWSLRMLDAWGSIPSGMLYGNTRDMGNYDECINIRREMSTGNVLKGKYCFAALPLNKLIGISFEYWNTQIAVCFPSSCTSTHIDLLLQQLFKQLLSIDFNLQLVRSESCQTADPDPLDGLTIFTIVILSVLCGLMVLATLYDYFLCGNQKDLPRLIKVFSARVNARAIFRIVPNKSNPNVIDCLHGIRCLSLIWVVLGHDYTAGLLAPNLNSIHAYTWFQKPFAMLIVYAVFAVDTFFFLSGLLVVLLALRVMDRQKGKLNVPLMYLHRYLRLTPVLAVAILVYMKLLPHLGDGPLWNEIKLDNYEACESNWFYTLLYIQNYAAKNLCLGHSWYLAVDMQLYIISPILLFALYKWGKKAVAGIIVFMFLLAACLFSMMVINHYSLQYTRDLNTDSQRKIYFATQTRASPWLIGFVFGYFLHVTRGKKFKLSPLIVWLGWLLSLSCLFTCLFALYGETSFTKPALSHVGEAFYLTLSRMAWPLGLCWVVFACMQGYGGLANSFLSYPMWQPMSRLSYCAYIWHMIVIAINFKRTRTNTYFANYDMFLQFWSDFGLTLLVAFFMYIIVEAPLGGLESLILPDRKAKTEQLKPTQRLAEPAAVCNESNPPLDLKSASQDSGEVDASATAVNHTA